MSGSARTVVVTLSEDERAFMEELSRSRTAPAHHIERAQIILKLASGLGIYATAKSLGVHWRRVATCAKRIGVVGVLAAINDMPRSGHPTEITAEARIWVIAEACVKPMERGFPHESWTLRLLTAHASCRGPLAGHYSLAGVVPSTIWNILNSHDVKPHKIRYYLERRDAYFDDKAANVLDVYRAAHMLREIPDGERCVAIVSYDEKPGIQAIGVTAPDRPPVPKETSPAPDKGVSVPRPASRTGIDPHSSGDGDSSAKAPVVSEGEPAQTSESIRSKAHATTQRDHEYKRFGTVTLSAAIDLVTGVVHKVVGDRHRSREFIEFLMMLNAYYPPGVLICVLLDNHSAHKSKETRRFLETCAGRFEFVFTPTHASWLNHIETYFSKMARSVLRYIRVKSKEELADRITCYVDLENRHPRLPRWSFRICHEDELAT